MPRPALVVLIVVLIALLAAVSAASVQAMPADVAVPTPSFDCTKMKLNSVETAVCASPMLLALDAEMSRLYNLATAAGAIAVDDVRHTQTAWIGRRNACGGRATATTCLRDAYVARIEAIRMASPEARKAEGIVFGPFAYRCPGIDGVTAMYVNTTPSGLLALEWAKNRKVLEQAMSADGARYTGSDGVEFWSKGRGATFVRARGEAAIECTQQPDS
jgi:uncharacterized protein